MNKTKLESPLCQISLNIREGLRAPLYESGDGGVTNSEKLLVLGSPLSATVSYQSRQFVTMNSYHSSRSGSVLTFSSAEDLLPGCPRRDVWVQSRFEGLPVVEYDAFQDKDRFGTEMYMRKNVR